VNPPEAVVSRNDELYPDDVPLACWGNLQKIQEYRRAQEAPIEHPVAFSSRSVLSDSDAPRAVISMPTERTTLQGGEEVLETSAELEPHVDTPIHSPIVQGLSTQPYFSDADYAALGFDLYEDPTFEVNTGFDHIECECSVRPPSAVQCAAQDAGTGNLTTETRIQHIEPTLPTLGNTQFDINFPYKEGEFKQAAQDNEKKQLEVHIGHSQVGVTPDREKFFRVASVLSQELISEQPSQVNVAIPSSEPTLEIVTENTLVSESAGPALSIDTCAIDPIPHDPFKNVELSMAPVSLVCFGFDASLFEASYRQHRFEEKVREKFKDLTIPEDWLNQKAWITQNLEPKLKDMFVENFDCVELFLSLPGMSQFCGRLNREFKKEKTRRNSVLKAENSFG
ncbi:MAG: hypothetical protein EBX40_07960, partial [Gammaproteobacteria bacterium]|nr:hypothetical protein [Gammaproteobacteria bacterium]